MRGRRAGRRAFLVRAGAATAAVAAAGTGALRPWAALAAPAVDVGLERFRALCLRIARANMLDRKLYPSAAYSHGTWLRDAYWTLLALGDRGLKQYTWERFANGQNPFTGRVPTALLHSEEVYYARDDESTPLFLLLALDIRRSGGSLWPQPLRDASRYVRDRVDAQGRVWAGPGPFAWWLDTLILEKPDVVAYNQGIWAVALRAAAEMGYPLPPGVLERTEAAYAALFRADLGTMTLSAGTTLLDVSCLVGEHLSQRLFGRSLLDAATVASTLGSFRQVHYPDGAFLGYPVASQLDGSYMPEDWFYPAPDNFPGYYHNGGSWLLYDALALDAARFHGVPEAEDLLRARIAAETRVSETLHEYIATHPAHLGTVPHPWRKDYSWNAYVATLV